MSDSEDSSSPQLGSKIKIYTKTGDKGTTCLYNMQRMSKDADYFDALGHNDELNSHLGLVREHFLQMVASGVITEPNYISLEDQIITIQSRLFDVGAAIATPKTQSSQSKVAYASTFDEDNITMLEEWIDAYDAQLPPLALFILPSGGLTASTLHVCRTIARRAERAIVPLIARGDCDEVIGRYINRLSDYLFIAARYAAKLEKKEEITWRKEVKRTFTLKKPSPETPPVVE